MPDKLSDAAVALREAGSMSVFCRNHPLAVLRHDLEVQGVVTAGQLRSIPSGRKVRLSGLLVIAHTPPTKSGKRVMFLTLEDETGLWDAVVFPKAQKDFARVIYTSELLTVEGKLQRRGRNGLSISIIVDQVILSWSGLLSEFLVDPVHNKG
jgi:DNA polymerase III alpha subunit